MRTDTRFRHLHEGMRSWLGTNEGQTAVAFLRGWCNGALRAAGAFRAARAIPTFRPTFFEQLGPESVMACLEHLVELGELEEVTSAVWGTPDPERVFVAARRERPTLAELAEQWPEATGAAAMPPDTTRHLEAVIVLTALQQAGRPLSLDELCARVEGEKGRVFELVQELCSRGKAALTTTTTTVVMAIRSATAGPAGSGDAEVKP